MGILIRLHGGLLSAIRQVNKNSEFIIDHSITIGQLAPNVAVQKLSDNTDLIDGKLLVGHMINQEDYVDDETVLVDGKLLVGHMINQEDYVDDATVLVDGKLLVGHTLNQNDEIGDNTVLVGGTLTMNNGEVLPVWAR